MSARWIGADSPGGRWIGADVPDSGSTVSGAGTATGAATAVGVGASRVAGVGSATGSATAAGVGAALVASAGTATGAASATGVGASRAAGAGSATGVATAAGVGSSTGGATTFTVAAMVAAGGAFTGAFDDGFSAGRNYRHPADGTTLAFSAHGSALEMGFFAGGSGEFSWSVDGGTATPYTFPGVVDWTTQALFTGLADGWHTVLITFSPGNCYLDDGTNAGSFFLGLTGSAPALGAFGGSTVSGAGSASGASTAVGVGASRAASAGTATGAATASGVGASVAAATGTATGSSTATGVGSSTSAGAGAGTANGAATATGVGASRVAGAGSASGAASASGVGASIAAAAGTAVGVATAVGFTPAASTASGAGTANGGAVAEGAGAAIGGDPVSIRGSVLAQLKASAAITAVVGGRIYPLIVPQRAAFPAITAQVISAPRGRSLDGPDGTVKARLQFAVLSYDLTDCETLAEAIRLIFDSPNLVLPGGIVVSESALMSETDHAETPPDGSDRWIYRTVCDYLILYYEPKPA